MVTRYLNWLRNGAPDTPVEPYPLLDEDQQTSLSGCYVIGDLAGKPLLKIAANQGSGIVRKLIGSRKLNPTRTGDGSLSRPLELLVVGAGAAGIAAARSAEAHGIQCLVLESSQVFGTISDFPVAKPIYLEPSQLANESDLELSGECKEDLLSSLLLQAQNIEVAYDRATRITSASGCLQVQCENKSYFARTVLLALGRSGEANRLGVLGEDLNHVTHRLFDPKDYSGTRTVIIGGGDAAVEAALACAESGALVSLIHRGQKLFRPKTLNKSRLTKAQQKGLIQVFSDRVVTEIDSDHVHCGSEKFLADRVLVLIGRQLPTQFLRASNIRMNDDFNRRQIVGLVLCLAFFTLFYLWKKGLIFSGFPGPTADIFPTWFTLDQGFVYGLIYSALVLVFGVLRVKRKPTAYIRIQTIVLAAVQMFPLFLLPTIIIPWLDSYELLPDWFKLQVLMVDPDYMVTGANAWRLYGLILAWPLFPFNWLTESPSLFWLIYGAVQSFVVIPWLVVRYGKGAYCGWICSCGALAETVGDRLRERTPHGPFWKSLEMSGQACLAFIFILTLFFVPAWAGFQIPELIGSLRNFLFTIYLWGIDFLLASVLGVGLYLYLGGRVWCRLFCPLAAMMHIFARFSRFAILSAKEKCISCGVCTRSCHQGIAVMDYAQRGKPMDDVQCVACSACIVECPTEVLKFGYKT